MALFNPSLLEALIEVRGASADERRIRDFLLEYIAANNSQWKQQPKIYYGDGFQDTIVLVFGRPKTAIYAHIDTVGFTTGYNKNLIKIGNPKLIDGTKLVGNDGYGDIETELMIFEDGLYSNDLEYIFDREINRGTPLTYKPNFRLNEQFVQSPYLDNRLGVLNALTVAETLENGAIVFSTYEEIGGNSVGFLARFLYEKYGVIQALISDITWVTNGIKHDGGVAISLRDNSIPRQEYIKRIIAIAKKHNIPFQLEVEASGGSDGTTLQNSDLPIDWCFVGAPEDNVHSPNEKAFLSDIEAMIALYQVLMKEL